jgi:predicted Zn-dependent protease
MGLLIMAQAGFDPQKRVNYLKDRLDQEREWLAGREPLPEFLSTHPSVSTFIFFIFPPPKLSTTPD